MSHETELSTTTELKFDPWVQVALESLRSIGVTYAKQTTGERIEYGIRYPPIEGYTKGENLRLIRDRPIDRFHVRGDDWNCGDAMSNLLLRIEDAYLVEANRVFLQEEGFSSTEQNPYLADPSAVQVQEVIINAVRY